MNVLIYDYLFAKGHVHPNEHYIKLISEEHNAYVISTHNFFNEICDSYLIINVESPLSIDDIRNNRLNQILFCGYVAKKIKKMHIDVVVLLSYDSVSFSVSRKLFLSNYPILLQNHNNIDRLERHLLERCFFRTFKNKVGHIVYEDFMKDALVEHHNVNRNNIFVLPRARFSYIKRKANLSYTAIGLSGSNDSSYIRDLIQQLSCETYAFKDVNILLKGNFEYKDPHCPIQVINHRVSDEEYQELFNSTRIILDPLPLDFKYRMSAVMFEGLSNRKITIGTDVEIIKFFAKKYPHICYSARTPIEMINLIKNIPSIETEEEKNEFDQFDSDYSDFNTIAVLNSALNFLVETGKKK